MAQPNIWPHPPTKHPSLYQSQAPDGATTKDLVVGELESRSGSALFSEDFENGLNGWVVDTQTGPVSWTLTSTGNTGGFAPGPLESTSGFPNGSWITADSDAQGTPGIQEVTTITSPPITNVSSYPALILEFEQSFRQLNDDETTVEISHDGGNNWLDFPINTEIVGNQSTPGAPSSQLISLNITDALNGGASDLRIRFRWVSFEGFTYAWNVDDIHLYEAPGNDVVINNVTYSQWYFDQASDFSTLEYSVYPVNLLRELNFKAVVTNNGTNAQTGVKLDLNVDGPGSNDFGSITTGIDMLSGVSDSLEITGYTPPAILGDYLINYTITQDQTDDVPDNNDEVSSFSVSHYTFARDRGALDGIYDNQGDAYEIGNWFHVNNWGSTLYAIDVALSNQSDPGALIVAVLYDSNRDYITESEEYLVQASDLNGTDGDNFITLPLIDETVLDQDEDYLVVLKHYGGNENVVVGTSGVSLPQTSLILDVPINTWFYVTSTPMVRMNLDPSVGIAENGSNMFTELSIYPNPATTDLRINYDLLSSSEVSLELIDMMGRSVLQKDLGKQITGRQQVDLDVRSLSKGVYTAVLTTSGNAISHKLVVE